MTKSLDQKKEIKANLVVPHRIFKMNNFNKNIKFRAQWH